MYGFIKGLDPQRLVSYADDRIAHASAPDQVAAKYADFIMWNQYYGSWHGAAAGLAPALDRIDRMFPDKMLVISEFGFAGVHAPDAATTDRLRIDVMRTQMAEFARRPWIAGAVFWCYQDYLSHRNLSPGRAIGQVDMGIVDEYRQRKPSFQVWQGLNEPATIVVAWNPPASSGAAPAGFRATIARRGEDQLPSYALRGYTARWEVRDAVGAIVTSGARELAEMGPPQSIDATWTPAAPLGMTLTLELVRPTGHVAATRTLTWYLSRSGGQDIKGMDPVHQVH